ARGAAIVAAAGRGGGLEIQGKRLTKTAEFFLEAGFFAPPDGAAATAMPPKTLELCRSKFFSLVADIAAKPLFWQTSTSSGTNKEETKSKSKKSPSKKKLPTGDGGSAGWGALEALWGLHETWQGLEEGGRKLAKGVTVGVDEREACSLALAVVGQIRAAARDDKLGSAFAGILLMVSLHMLEGSQEGARGAERHGHITDLVETYGRMSGSIEGEEDDDDDEEEGDRDEPDPLAMLADVLVAVVAEPSTHSVRGLRDTARRVWGMVCGSTRLTRSALNTLVAAVCGDQDAYATQGGNESSSEEEEEEDDNDEDDEEMANSGKAGAEGKGSSDGEQESSSDDSDSESDNDENDGDKDEVMVDPSDVEALLGGEDEGEDGEGGLQHHAGADKALGALLRLKQSGRKNATLEAQRQGYQIRLRALDLLEV
ncbi:unnamed protein product, partial [Ectocarpus fasciculatus]